MSGRFTGVDIGSSYTKAVVVDSKGKILSSSVRPTGMDFEGASKAALAGVLNGASGSGPIIATGVGRSRCRETLSAKTEISCIARGSYYYHPRPHVVVDIGGQDNKVVRVAEGGRQKGFKMNRKCAAGTGAFLEEIARRLDVEAGRMSEMAGEAKEIVEIGSYCTVFTCTEIIHHIREGAPPSGILRGCYESVVKRILEMDSLEGDVLLSGGVVAVHPIFAEILREKTGKAPIVPPHPQFIGALGAALFSLESHEANTAKQD